MTKQTFYFVYRTTNTVNNKYYIGKHKTTNLDDGYIGSGKLLKRAISKYGLKNFQFEILEWFDSEHLMNAAEAALVTEEFCLRKDTYNLCVGGKGGFSYINREGIGGTLGRKRPDHEIKQMSMRRITNQSKLTTTQRSDQLMHMAKMFILSPMNKKGRVGFPHSVRSKRKIGEANKVLTGEKNSQFGTMWITNGQLNKKQKTVDVIPKGWYKGRTVIRHAREV